MNKKSALFSVLVTSVFAAGAPQAMAFGLDSIKSAIPGVGGGSSATSVSAGDIDGFIKTASDAATLIKTSSDYMFRAVSTKDAIEQLDASLTAANSIADPKEQQAKREQIASDEITKLQKTLASNEGQAKLKNMNKDQLKLFGNAGFNFMLGVLKDKQLADGSRALVSGVAANPTLAMRLGELKDATASVSDQVSNTASIGGALIKLANAGVISSLPKSKDEPAHAESTM